MAPIEYDACGRMKYNPDLHKNNGTTWSEDDLNYLINWYEKIGIEEMSLALGKSEGTVAHKVQTLRKQGIMKNNPVRIYHRRLTKEKATKNPDQSILSSTGTLSKNPTSLYHEMEVCQ
ncbi:MULTISPECIES: hypothetical protein [Clostridium]|uniref:Uncharacterized protein n=1 Tax=Clostridium carnis TaxID=1530 RepID=A0ABY6STJ3_9CLOT|nr:hypothetical protein [Clostridium carnis]CAI3662242.1 hypothetical protein CNEO3_530027 [Clostridium neonatale]CAI3662761.1 hypothetical protein CNEO3_720027 [Clostridium neonatale]CAI3683064.1 hypothetical protein CNEO3_580027 [Clostridium neonatale]CAI3694483.1 hypothetical protein CNEO3_570027 [Clostridium neonatale]CAI3706945.1 hypothetical protein CNEO3_810027 [Clostridium neonatale]